ncbi:AEC family transporter [Vibrio paucivorans]|uniref:AEC family transporter n=1 Tax=Vibrio paucivorans TaxID=2829489 RepID=A0A9X3CE84_9VIBR|nr:AEC family transporter [Vibrio paucivorans]MCW8334219.1 AEC family transporter [Vibrio paucivorans]
MTSLFEQLIFSASITGPICLMLFLGVFLKRVGLINDNFIDVASKLVFQVTLPIMLFLSIVTSEHDFASSSSLIAYGVAANLAFFIATSLFVRRIVANKSDHGVVIQGGFRANTAIIALAYVANAYGESGVALAAIYVAAITILYNVQAVIALTPVGESSATQAITMMSKSLTRNPLIIAILLGVACYFLPIPIPTIALDAGQYFANMTLPLALLCTGGSLNVTSLRNDQAPAWLATSAKLVIAPLLITLGGIWFGFRGMDLGILFLMSAAPTAAASYVMARSMGGNSVLAANIIAMTTVLSLLTCTLGIFILSGLSLI